MLLECSKTLPGFWGKMHNWNWNLLYGKKKKRKSYSKACQTNSWHISHGISYTTQCLCKVTINVTAFISILFFGQDLLFIMGVSQLHKASVTKLLLDFVDISWESSSFCVTKMVQLLFKLKKQLEAFMKKIRWFRVAWRLYSCHVLWFYFSFVRWAYNSAMCNSQHSHTVDGWKVLCFFRTFLFQNKTVVMYALKSYVSWSSH